MRQVFALGCLVIGVIACVPDPKTFEGDGVRPEDSQTESIQEGLVTCAPRSRTGYSGGQAFGITVVSADGKPAEVKTANAYHLMLAAAADDGVHMRVVSGFRSQAEQDYLYSCYVNCACNNCNLAAYPGYSNHQSGSALDLNTDEWGVYGWLAANGAHFGFYETVPGEDWHWEYYGPSPGVGPCRDDGQPAAPPGPELTFVTPREGGQYVNGVWLKTEVSEGVALVRYSADGWFLGASEDDLDNFSVRYVFGQLGARVIKAEAVDAFGNVVATQEVRIEVTPGATQNGKLTFTSLRVDGWYRNGVQLRTQPEGAITRVTYSAGPYVLGRSEDAAGGFPLRYVFSELGYRTVRAVGFDTLGQEVARRSVAIRVLPGDEGPVGVQIVAPSAGAGHPGAVRIVSLGSTSVARVDYSADGWALGSVAGVGEFELSYTFNQSGPRTLRAEAFDAAGAPLSQDEVTFEVR
jgi:hypothetical protein